MMPKNVRQWTEGASLARMRRDFEQATVHANQNVPLHERHDWLNARKHELEYAHVERMSGAEKKWPRAVEEFEQEFIKRTVMVFDGRYNS